MGIKGETLQFSPQIIPPDLEPGQSVLLYDSRHRNWTVDTELMAGMHDSIFLPRNGAGLTVELNHVCSEGKVLTREFPDQEYTFLLSGSVQPGERRAPCFVGNDSTAMIEGHTITVRFWNGNIPDVQRPSAFCVSDPAAQLLSTDVSDGNGLRKVWFTGSFGSFSQSDPGYNPYLHIGLGYTPELYREDELHLFRNNSFQLYIPLPTNLCDQEPTWIQYMTQQYGSGGVCSIGSRSVSPYQIIGGSEPVFGSYQRKMIPQGVFFLLIHVLSSPDKFFPGRKGLYEKDTVAMERLPPFEMDYVICL